MEETIAGSVTFKQVIEHILRLPDGKLSQVYEFVTSLEDEIEDEDDLAAIAARRGEPARPVEEFFAELDAQQSQRTGEAFPEV